jgi:hypothetical protein
MANPIVIRPDADHVNVPALEDAYQKMQAISESDNRSWIYWAEFPGFNRYECWHHASVGGSSFSYDLFLPWHRSRLSSKSKSSSLRYARQNVPWARNRGMASSIVPTACPTPARDAPLRCASHSGER